METYFIKGGIENGKPILVPNENIIYFAENVTIYQGENKTDYKNGNIYLTQNRTCWVGSKLGLSLQHDGILSIELFNVSVFAINSSPKITITLPTITIKYSFHSGKRDEFFAHFKQQIIIRKQFLNQNQPPPYIPPSVNQYQQPPPPYPGYNNNNNNNNTSPTQQPTTNTDFSSKAGISGLIKQINQKSQETDKILSEAFSDLNALMDKAKDMVNLSEKLKITLEKKSKDKDENDTAEENEFRSFLLQMGIESPVTKKTAGSKYHNELSKQLSDWIISKQVLTKHSNSINSGMILLSDLYCIFNRARGIELISPDDLYRACLLFESLNLPLRMRKFDSGVIIIQSIDENDEQIAKEILELIKENGPITPFDLSKFQQISLSLSNEKLLASEKTGRLCRDETVEGIKFYENIFV